MKQQNEILNNSLTIYQQIKSRHPYLKLYSSKDLKQVLSWYITNGDLTINQKKKLCQEYSKIDDNSYYHLVTLFKILKYDNWILKQISKTL